MKSFHLFKQLPREGFDFDSSSFPFFSPVEGTNAPWGGEVFFLWRKKGVNLTLLPLDAPPPIPTRVSNLFPSNPGGNN